MRAALVVVLGSLLPWSAFADDTHYQDYPVGGRAVGLGGAFVALANDPSGIYYNPAGLVNARQDSVQLSSNLYGLEISDSFFNAVQRATELDTIFTELNIIPASAAFSGVIVEDETGKAITSYALGAFVPSYRSLIAQTTTSIDDASAGCRNLSYQRTLLDRTFYFGASVGHRLDARLRFGAGAFLAYRSLRDQEATACFESADSVSTAFASAETTLRLSVASVLIHTGIQYDVDERLTLGLTVTGPSIDVLDFADLRVLRASANPATDETRFSLRELKGLPANTKHGTAVRLGGAYVLHRQATFTFDLSFHAPTRYALFEIPSTEQELARSFTVARDVRRRAVVNLNAGAEVLLLRWFSVAGGLFTNFSSAEEIPGDVGAIFTEDRLPDIDAFGGSLVAGFFTENTLTRVGFTMSYGSGTDVVPRYEGLAALGEPADLVKVQISQLFAYLFISSTFRY